MNAFQVAFVIAIAFIANSCGNYAEGNDYSNAAAPATYSEPAPAAPSYSSGKQVLPYSPVQSRGSTVSSSVTYPENKGEILIHRPAAIIVKRPPTKLVVNHAPVVVKPPPVVFHKPGALVVRKVFVNNHPQSVKVTPLYVHVVKSAGTKYYVKGDKPQEYAPKAAYQSEYAYPSQPAQQPQLAYSSELAPQTQPAYQSESAYPSESVYSNDEAAALSNAGKVDVLSGPPVYASATSDLAASRAGYQLVQDSGLSALANFGQVSGPSYNEQSSVY